MIKPDEVALRRAILAAHDASTRPRAYEIAADIGMHPKRLSSIIEKWERKRWWDCGVSLRTGWLTAEGLAALRAWREAR